MPTLSPPFYPDDIEIDIDDFLEACDPREIEEVIEYLSDEGYLKKASYELDRGQSIHEQNFNDCLSKIHNNYLSLTSEEEAVLYAIAQRF